MAMCKKSCSNLDSDKYIGLAESDCEESEESADVIDNIPVILIYRTLGMKQNGYRILVMFLEVLRQSSGSTSFAKKMSTSASYDIKGHNI
ncbi:hypothetical protein TNCV_3689741 [Trichonephila clavipes]|uniref:Uncharacterized protein n=1 Tax=Trichonephila clavipes TaxID=2585209 RepID=A0A8X6SNX0_TRICX|nr:hypothetical protein TNCV_3689741 [Trichonephila clavipes]